jgi:hypothetical protein
MLSLRKKTTAADSVDGDETWADSALWGASLALLLVVMLLFGVGYFGYSSLERSQSASVSPAARVAVPLRAR